MIRIEHIALYCRNLEAMREFFEKYFSCVSNDIYQNDQISFSSYFLTFPDGKSRLEIMTRPEIHEEAHGNLRPGLIHIALSLGDRNAVDVKTDELIDAGYACLSQPRTTGDGYYESCIEGPEGLVIELTI